MAKTDNPHTIRLYQSILKYSDEDTAERIANRVHLSKSSDFVKKIRWAECICADLEKAFDENTVKLIRMDCACGSDPKRIKELKSVFLESSGIDDFVEKVNLLDKGFTLLHEDHSLFLIYPQCYCSCVKRGYPAITKTWCYCTLGYTKKLFEGIFDHAVEVDLLESVKTGGSVCKIKIDYGQ